MEYGLFVDYEWCSGCHACELACKQEHDHKTDEWGIRVTERVYRGKEKVTIEYIPIPTDYCDFCYSRVKQGQKPACVHHCMTKCMEFGPMPEMEKLVGGKKKTVVFGRTF